MQNHIIVHYGELRLKGRNRFRFEDKLISNIRKICGGSVEKLSSSLLCRNSKLENFKFISGISWYASCIKLSKDFTELINYIKNIDKSNFINKKSFAVRIKRSDKKFEYDSNQLAITLGDLIRTEYGLRVDLNNPDITFYIEISEYILVHYQKNKGIGGFPAGIHGKVLCLLSGGIDSPVAAYEIIRKGCSVDFLHFHAFSENIKLKESKIISLVNLLNRYQVNAKLYVVPSYYLDLNIFNNINIRGYEMILFRKFIITLAQKLALKYKYKALVTGDSLGQVASQTLDNLKVYKDIKLPLLQPLIAYDKQDIIDKAKVIGSYDISIQPYKDCCSIVSKKPVTNVNTEKLEQIESEIFMDSIINQSLKNISAYDIQETVRSLSDSSELKEVKVML